jgi:hypothetical protein
LTGKSPRRPENSPLKGRSFSFLYDDLDQAINAQAASPRKLGTRASYRRRIDNIANSSFDLDRHGDFAAPPIAQEIEDEFRERFGP